LDKRWTILSLALVTVMAIASFPSASAVSLSNLTYDKSTYNPGDQGTATLQFLNDQGALIRITAVSMTFNYFYQDGRVYIQSFILSGQSVNVTVGSNSSPIAVRFSLPSDIAGGYFLPSFQVTFNQLQPGGWSGDRQDFSTATKPLYTQSSYYQLYQSAQTVEYIFIVLTVLFLATTGYFAMRYWSLKGPSPRPSH
jgi:hypothetical protein